MNGSKATGCSNCGHIEKNHKTPVIRVQVTSVFEIPISDCDKKHILWDNTDLTKFAREIIGHGIFAEASNSHLISQMDCQSKVGVITSNIKNAQKNQTNLEREEKYVDMIHYATHDYTILKSPDSKGDWHFQRQSGYAGYRCNKCAEWVYENKPQVCICDTEAEKDAGKLYKIQRNSYVKFKGGYGIVYSVINDTHAMLVIHNGMKITTTYRKLSVLKQISKERFHKLIEDAGDTAWYSQAESIKTLHHVTV